MHMHASELEHILLSYGITGIVNTKKENKGTEMKITIIFFEVKMKITIMPVYFG